MEVGFTKPKIVLAGVGKFGKNHLRVLKELEIEGLCALHGVVDMRGVVLEKVGRSHGVRISTDLNDFLTNDVRRDRYSLLPQTPILHFVTKAWKLGNMSSWKNPTIIDGSRARIQRRRRTRLRILRNRP